MVEKKEFNEIRLDENGNEDDIVIACDSIHLERMDDNCWWLGIYKDGKRTTFDIQLIDEWKIQKTMVSLVENELKTKIVKLK